MHKLTAAQKKDLLKNPNVEKISNKSIFYTSRFKREAVEKYLSGVSADKIFEDAKVSLDGFIDRYAHSAIMRWNKKRKDYGIASLDVRGDGQSKGKGGKPKNLKRLSHEELIAVIEIQKEVIGDLKKRRALALKRSR